MHIVTVIHTYEGILEEADAFVGDNQMGIIAHGKFANQTVGTASEEFFTKRIKEISSSVTEEEIERAIEDGLWEYHEHMLFLTRPNVHG